MEAIGATGIGAMLTMFWAVFVRLFHTMFVALTGGGQRLISNIQLTKPVPFAFPPGPGPAPGPAAPGPAAPGPATPGPAAPGPATPGPAALAPFFNRRDTRAFKCSE